MNRQIRESIWKANFRPPESMAEFETLLRGKLGLPNRNDVARLALGRSLAESTAPEPTQGAAFGKAIAGEHLFGDDIDLWICALVEDGQLGEAAGQDDLRALVEAHWSRGLVLLREDLESSARDEARFLSRLADFLPEDSSRPKPVQPESTGLVRLRIGSVSTLYPSGEPVEMVLNGQGTSPHIALMGKVGSGKTTTGMQIAKQMLEQTCVPVLVIDPKGEFVDRSHLTGRMADLSIQVNAIEVGETPIPLDFLPDPSVGSVSIQNAAMQLRDSIALCCKGAGDIQKDILRDSIEKVIRHAQPRSLEAIRDCYKSELDAHGKTHDSIMSRLNELTRLSCFSPSLSPSEFLSQSWVLSLRFLATEELKRLVILMLLDTLRFYLLSQPDAAVVDGYRGLRHLLVIDEARRILAEKKYQSLVDIVRQGRSKGSVVILLSQDPSDFDGQADDFTTQLGSVIAFACSQTQHGLRALQGVYGRKVLPAEFADTHLPPGIAFAKLPGRGAERITCWIPNEGAS